MTYDPVDTDADGVVESDVNNSLTQADDLDLKGGDAAPRMADAVVVPQLSDPIYHVSDYADAGAAFNAAETDLGGGGTIYLPAGETYSTDMEVNNARTVVEGHGPESAALTYTGSGDALRNNEGTHVYLTNMHLVGGGKDGSGANAVHLRHDTSLIARNYVERMRIEDFDGSAVLADGQEGCFVNRLADLRLSDIYDSTAAVHLTGKEFSDSSIMQIDTTAGTISGDMIKHQVSGKVWIENCSAEPSVEGHGFNIRNGKNVVLYANKAEGCSGDGFHFSANTRNWSILANEARGNSGRGFYIDDFLDIWLSGNWGMNNTNGGMVFGNSGNTKAYVGNNDISYSGLSNITDGFMLERGWFPNFKMDANTPAQTGYQRVQSFPICFEGSPISTTSTTYTGVSGNAWGMINKGPFVDNNIYCRLTCMGENTNGSTTYIRPVAKGKFDNVRRLNTLEITFNRNSDQNKRFFASPWVDVKNNFGGSPLMIRNMEMKVDGGTGQIYSKSLQLQFARKI